jgi:hypothetical protein
MQDSIWIEKISDAHQLSKDRSLNQMSLSTVFFDCITEQLCAV